METLISLVSWYRNSELPLQKGESERAGSKSEVKAFLQLFPRYCPTEGVSCSGAGCEMVM